MRAFLCAEPSPAEQCFTETMLGPCSAGPCTLVQLPAFAYPSGKGPSPITGAFGLIRLILPLPMDTSCLLSSPFFDPKLQEEETKNLLSCPHFSFALHTKSFLKISCSLIRLEMLGTVQVPPRWDIRVCLLPISILQGPTVCDE